MEEQSNERFPIGIGKKSKLTLEKYLDFLRSRDDSLLTVSDLQQIISLQGLTKSFRGTKVKLVDALSQTSLTDPSRSTLGLSNMRPASLKLDDIVMDIADLDWQECPVAYVRTINPVQYSTDNSNSPTGSNITNLAVVESQGSQKKKENVKSRSLGGSGGNSDGWIVVGGADGNRSNGEQISGALAESEGLEKKNENLKKRSSRGSDGRSDGWIVVGGRDGDRSNGEQSRGGLAESGGSEQKKIKSSGGSSGRSDDGIVSVSTNGDCSGASAVVQTWFSPFCSPSRPLSVSTPGQRKKTKMRQLHSVVN